MSPKIHPDAKSAPPAGNRNSWEKGTVVDHRGVPVYADTSSGAPISVKQYAGARSRFESDIRRLESHPDPFRARADQGAKEGR